MSKKKQVAPKKTAKKSPKYSKILAVASKELEGKKKSLVQAERALAKAKQKHEELIAEVARLDMVERSLKALVEGTEPPQNVRYVYNYPQWVWQPSIYTIPSYQQPAWTNATPNWQYTPTVTCGGLQGQNSVYTANSGNVSLNTSGGGSLLTTNATIGSGGSLLTTNATIGSGFTEPGQTFTFSNTMAPLESGVCSSGRHGELETHYQDGSITVDLSTNAEIVEPEYLEATATASNS